MRLSLLLCCVVLAGAKPRPQAAEFTGVPDGVVSSALSADPVAGVPDVVLSQNSVDYGAGIVVTPQRPGQTGHYNPFNPNYQPPKKLSQATELVGGGPTPTQRPVFTQRPTTRRPTFTQRPTTRRPPFNRRPTTRRPPFTQRPTTRRPSFTQRPTTRRPPFNQRPTTRRPSFGQQSQGGRPSNPFLTGQVSLVSNFQHRPVPVPQGPRPTPEPIKLVNTNPLGGPAGPKGDVVATCPAPASALPCVPDAQCDPYTGFLKSDGVKLPYPITKDTPTVAVLQCKLKTGGIGICCKKFPRPAPTTTTTAIPLGTDYGQGLNINKNQPGNVFLPNYKPRPLAG